MEIRILPESRDAVEHALEELRQVRREVDRPLISFATGATYRPLLRLVTAEALGRCTVTHPDEYLGYGPDREGGMARELLASCPAIRLLGKRGGFFPVPASDDEAALAAHTQRLARAGGVSLQLLGIGHNGHIAFNEPGSGVESGFHRVRLAESTRRAAAARFPGCEPPEHAITAGLGELLGSRRIVLTATGSAKAEAVRGMLKGEIEPSCPASYLRRHHNVLVLLDRGAASLLAAANRGRETEA